MFKPNEDAIRAANKAEVQSWANYLDLSVALGVELGRTKLTAEEILALEQSSIIQLARSTGEGVDLMAGGKRIARGEIIMIEDRTGVRINEIVAEDR